VAQLPVLATAPRAHHVPRCNHSAIRPTRDMLRTAQGCKRR
jgi:hypothetical protein